MEVFVKKEKLKCRDLGSVLLIYDYANGVVVELNESARFVWDCLDNSNVKDVIQKFSDHYGVDINIASEDVYSVLNELEAKGIINRKAVLKQCTNLITNLIM
ncbi:MAG: PqqD family protein [Peptococcaceae bacterium]|nr:PqqD family protein [Peptococcaceae bacterium]